MEDKLKSCVAAAVDYDGEITAQVRFTEEEIAFLLQDDGTYRPEWSGARDSVARKIYFARDIFQGIEAKKQMAAKYAEEHAGEGLPF